MLIFYEVMLVAAVAAIARAIAGSLAVVKSGRPLARRLVFAVVGGFAGLLLAQSVAFLAATTLISGSETLLQRVNGRDVVPDTLLLGAMAAVGVAAVGGGCFGFGCGWRVAGGLSFRTALAETWPVSWFRRSKQ
jgi:hypothetical protein